MSTQPAGAGAGLLAAVGLLLALTSTSAPSAEA